MFRSCLPSLLAVGLALGSHAQFVSTTNTGLGALMSLAVDPQGNRYVSDRSANRVIKLDNNNTPTTYCGTGLADPQDLERGPGGELYVVNHVNGTVALVPPGGGAATVYASGFSVPRGVTLAPNGDLYVAEYITQRIYRVAPGGGSVGGPNVTQVVGTAGITGVLGGTNRLEDISWEPTGSLVATIGFGNPGRIYRIALPSGAATMLASSPLITGAFALNVNQQTGNIYVTAIYSHRIFSLTPNGTLNPLTGDGVAATLDGPLASARFDQPAGIAVDPVGNIWITQYNGDVRRIGLQPAEVPTNGLRLWLRADRGLLRNGSTVTQWLDQSGSANHATPTGALFTPQPPTFVTDVVNGYPAVRFNGVNSGLTTPAFQTFPNKRGTIFSVVRVNAPSSTSGGGHGTIVGTYFANSGTQWQYASNFGAYAFYDGVGQTSFNVASNPPNTWGIATFLRNADSGYQFFKSGIPAGGGGLANNQPSALPVHIGWNDYPSTSLWEVLNGDIAEVLIYDLALTPAEIEQVNTYLANKYTFNGDIPLPTASGTTICGPGSATLTASGGTAYRWYDSPTATVPLATTASFTTPVLGATTTYYVANYPGTLVSQRVPVTVTVNLPGTACDDGNPGTINDVLNGQCQCAGTPIYQDQNLALALDGNFQYASTLAQPTLTIGPALTLEAWIKPEAFVFGEIFSVCNDPNSPCSGQDYKALAFRVDGSGVVTALIAPTTYASRLVGKQTTTSLVLGQWVHVAATLDLGTNEAHIYFNGIEQPGINLTAGTGSGSFTDRPAIGALQVTGLANSIQYPFSGSIDELRVWNTALPQTSIAQYACAYSLAGHPQSSNLVALYHIEDGQAPDNTVVDAVGGRNATLTNASVATAYVASGAAQGGACGCALGPIGAPCNDGNPNTANDVLQVGCVCAGTPVITCNTDLVLEFDTDANAAQISWELRASGSGDLMQSGSGLPGPVNSLTVNTCLPDGCYYLRVLDSGGDGIANGGYMLRTLVGAQRIIDNRDNFTTGSVSAVIGNGGFCLPLGTDRLIFTSCDKLDWVNNQFIVAAPNPAVSAQWGIGDQTDDGYQFWWFDPNGSYGYTKFRSHATSDGFGPANAVRACHARINNWSPNQIPANVLMNVKVRTRVNGANSAWGPVCRFKIDPVRAACPLTKLMDIPGNQFFSCNVIRTWGGNNRIHARPVDGATQYQFRFWNTGEGVSVVRTTGTYFLNLNWTPALPYGTYQVEVRAFKGTAWCVEGSAKGSWGDLCNVTITGSTGMALDGGSTTVTASAAKLFPNPNNGDQLTLSLSAVEEGVGTIAVDIFDLNGARVSAQVIAVNDGMVYQVVDVAGLADGLYMVNITAGGQRYTERLVIAK